MADDPPPPDEVGETLPQATEDVDELDPQQEVLGYEDKSTYDESNAYVPRHLSEEPLEEPLSGWRRVGRDINTIWGPLFTALLILAMLAYGIYWAVENCGGEDAVCSETYIPNTR